MSTPPSCKLEFIFAKKAKKAVIVRRGPSKWTQLILWTFEGKDKFEPGQWINQRSIGFELNEDASLLLYGVTNYRPRKSPGKGFDDWFAISHPPYWTAVAFWPCRMISTTGVHFFGKNKIYVDPKLSLDSKYKITKHKITQRADDESLKDMRNPQSKSCGEWELRWEYSKKKSYFSEGPYRPDTFVLVSKDQKRLINLSELFNASWADIDILGRVVVANHGGQIFRSRKKLGVNLHLEFLIDLSNYRPTSIPTPKWALKGI